MSDRFTTIVVPLDLKPNSERAVGVAGALAAIADLPVVLVTVSTEDRLEPDKARLHQVATRCGLTKWEPVVLHDHRPGRAIATYLESEDHPLVVMASPVHGVVNEWLSLSTVAHVLSEVDCPVLVVGPHVERDWRPNAARLIACAEPEWDAGSALCEIARWSRTFAAPNPWVVEVIVPDDRVPPDARDSSLLMTTVNRLARSGVVAEWEVLHDVDPVDGLLRFAESVSDGMLLVTSGRWTDPDHVHAHSVSRELAHRSPRPVLVVPRASVVTI